MEARKRRLICGTACKCVMAALSPVTASGHLDHQLNDERTAPLQLRYAFQIVDPSDVESDIDVQPGNLRDHSHLREQLRFLGVDLRTLSQDVVTTPVA